MGIVIDTLRGGIEHSKHAHSADNFITDAAGRLIPHQGETFEVMPYGSLAVVAYVNAGKSYQQNPYTVKGMRWEIGFSKSRVFFYSPDTSLLFGGIAERPGHATLGFYYYSDLRSLSLGSAREQGGPYVSMVFVVQVNPYAQIPVGVRVHGTPQNLHAFATMLAARLVENYGQVGSILDLDMSQLSSFFCDVNSFDYHTGAQTDLFISAASNTLCVTRSRPQTQGT